MYELTSMAERDDTPGTEQDEINDDARPTEQEPDAEAIEEPTTDGEHEAAETAWMMKEGVTIGIISILAVLLLAVALMQATGVVELVPTGENPLFEWGAFAVLAILTIGLFAWSRRGV